MKQFFCDCTSPDYEELGVKDVNEFSDLINNSNNVTRKEFLDYCEIEGELRCSMFEYPQDYDYFRNGEIYFFTHSRIEHFYN